MVVKDTCRGKYAKRLAVIAREVVGENLGARVHALGIERSGLRLRHDIGLPEHVGGAGLEIADRRVDLFDDLQNPRDCSPCYVDRIINDVKAPRHVVLIGLIVYFVRPNAVYDPEKRGRVSQIATREKETLIEDPRILNEVLDIPRIAGR